MMNKQQGKKKLMIAGTIIMLIVVALVVIFVNSGSDRRKLSGLLDLGEKYLEELSYEDAILVFDEAIAIDPKCAQAYMGKAQAQYALGRYEEAVVTLQEGIEQVDDSAELEAMEAFLQMILDEISGDVIDEGITEVEEGMVEAEERSELPLLLNYVKIIRRVDTTEPEIQLEVLGGDTPEHYTWESSDPECVTVSETGLVTCLPVVGYASISVSNGNGWQDYCEVQISDSGEIEDSEDSRTEIGDKGKHLTISLKNKGGQEELGIIGEQQLGAYVYHSGDISIPEHLAYQGRDIPVTSFSTDAYYWCNTMESISIPASVGIEDKFGNYSNPFYYCFALEEISVDENNSALKSVDGVLYSKDGKELLSYPAAKSESIFTVPDEVERIWRGAFTGCKNLEEIVVGEGNVCYESISGVLMDKKQGSLEAYPIGQREVSYTIPDSITSIANDAFYMSELEEIKCESIEYISSYAFRKCSKLKKIEGGGATKRIIVQIEDIENVTEITGFNKMENLESLYISYFPAYASWDDVPVADFPINKQEQQNIKNLQSLKEIEIRGSFCLTDLSWLDGAQSLERLCISVDKIENDDLSTLQSLLNTTGVEIRGIETLTDISWVEDLKALKRFDMTANSIEVEDFSPLFKLPNLENVDISNLSESDGLEEKFEIMQAENPDVQIRYSEW